MLSWVSRYCHCHVVRVVLVASGLGYTGENYLGFPLASRWKSPRPGRGET